MPARAVLVCLVLLLGLLAACSGKQNNHATPAAGGAGTTPQPKGVPSSADTLAALKEQVDAGRLDQQVFDDMQANGAADGILVLDQDLIDERIKQSGVAQGQALTDQQIVDLRTKAYEYAKSRLLADAPGSTVLDDFKSFGAAHIRFPSADLLLAVLQRPEVSGVRANEVNSPKHDLQTSRQPPLSVDLALIHQPEAAKAGFAGAGTSVVVIDTGADWKRDAFGPCTAPAKPADKCRVGFYQHVPPDDGRLDSSTKTMHGTNVSGIVAAVAPSAQLIVFDAATPSEPESITDANAMKALDWVVQHAREFHIASVNLSFGGSHAFTSTCSGSSYTGIFDQLRRAGVVPVVAAGNDGFDHTTRRFQNGIDNPACAPGAVSVGAVYFADTGRTDWGVCRNDSSKPDQIPCFSMSGPNLSLLAPGVSIPAAGITDTGTSQAAPHVAAAVAAIASGCKGATPDQIEHVLESSGPEIRDQRNGVTKHRLDLLLAGQSLTGSGACQTGAARPATPAAASPPKPSQTAQQGLYNALLTTPFAANELPSGYSAVDTKPGDPGKTARQLNATGEVDVHLKGPDAGQGIFYTLFASDADARAYYQAEVGTAGIMPPGFNVPAGCVTGPITDSSGRRLGVTLCFAQSGAVAATSITLSSKDQNQGNTPATVSLLRSAQAHLQRVQSGGH